MKKIIAFFLLCGVFCFLLSLAGCQSSESDTGDNPPEPTVIELDVNNFWKYLNFNCENNGVSAGEKDSIRCEITGVLHYALYEDVFFTFDVLYYNDGQPDDSYQKYTVRIGCNAAGEAKFETYYHGITVASVGVCDVIDGELVSLENYIRKIELTSVSGKVIYRL